MPTKTFDISINGVSQSITAIDNLISRLDELEDRLNSISDDGIDVSEMRSSLQSIRREIEDASDGWEDFASKIEDASDNITKLERSMNGLDNPFNENEIRNYNNQVKDLAESMEDVSEASKDIDDLSDLTRDLNTADNAAKNLADSFNSIVRAEDQLGTKLTVNIGDMALQFDDVNQAIGVLEDKLYQLAQSGQTNSQAFTDITNEVVRLRQAVIQTDDAIDNAFSGGLNRLISGVSAFSSFASIGEGFSQLFGLDNSALDDTIQKFASLSLVLQGISEVQQQLQNPLSITSAAFKVLGSTADGFITIGGKLIGLIPGVTEGFSKLNTKIQQTADSFRNAELLQKYNDALATTGIELNNVVEAYSEFINRQHISDEGLKLLELGDTSKAREDVSNYIKMILDEIEDGGEEVEFAINNAMKTFDEMDEKFQNIEGLDSFKQLRAEVEAIDPALAVMPGRLNLIQRGWIKMAQGIKAVSVAFKALARTTIILALIQLAVEGITRLLEQAGKLFTSFKGDNTLATQFDTAQQSINNANEALERYIQNLEQLNATNAISNQTRLNESIDAYNRALEEAITRTQQLIQAQDKQPKSLSNNLTTSAWSGTWFTGAEIKNVEDFAEQFRILEKAVSAGVDRFKALEGELDSVKEKFGGNWWSEMWNTPGDARTDFAQAQIAVIQDIQYRLNNLDLSKGTEELEEFIELLNTDMYATSLANIENLFPENEMAKVLKANIDQIKEYYSEIKELQREAEQENIQLQNTITSNNIAAIRDRRERERAELENSYNMELQQAADNEELKESIRKKYHTQRIQLLRQQAQEIRSIQNSIDSNEIAAMSEGLDKQLAQIEQSRQQALDAAKDSELMVEEQILAINKNYDNQILEAKRQFYEQRTQLLESYNQQYRQLQQQVAQMEVDIATSRVEGRQADRIAELGYDDSSLDSVRQYYDKVRDIANEEAAKIAEINKEALSLQTDNEIANENQRNQSRIREIEDALRQGLITQEEYDSEIQKEMDNHYLMLETITRNGEQKILDIQREYDQTAKNNNATAINERINALNEAYSGVRPEVTTSSVGVINIVSSTKSLKEAENQYKEIFNNIALERENLQKQFDRNEISFGDFIQAKKELDGLEDSVSDALNDITLTLNTLVQNTVISITQYVGQYLNILGSLWSTYNDIQMAKLEAEQEALEEEYDMLEEAYDRQEDLTQSHTDKMKDLEDELTEARGDRRAHLIEQLNAERAALIASLQEEQNIDKQKEANTKKQDAVEAKRREQEKKNSIVQATINTYTAVTNALAVPPWFVGLALSAVALAMGMAQVAMIKKQKYADGGLLRGRSHNAGGIPVGMTGIEVEGNEYIVNKRSTQKNLPLIDYINRSNRTLTKEDLMSFYDNGKQNVRSARTGLKYADGGQLPEINLPEEDTRIVIEDDRPIVAQIVDIVNEADNYRQIRVLAGLAE